MPVIVEVVGYPVRHMGRLVRVGTRIELSEPMARAFVAQGRARAVDDAPPAKPQATDQTQRHPQHKRR